MPQDNAGSGDIIVGYTDEAGGRITVTIDGEDFVISASRTKPRPIIEQAEGYIGTIASAAWHHPTDVTIPILLAPVLAGTFNPIAPQAQQNAQAVMRIAMQALHTVWRDPEHLRLALQLFLVYKQTDLRGQMLLASTTRIATGMTFSSWLFTLGGRLKKGGVAGAVGRGVTLFILSSIGAIYRVSLNALREMGPDGILPTEAVIAAIITGEDRIISLPREIGVDAYFQIRNYLREHPESIQLQDTELQLIQAAINGFFDFIADPRGFISSNPPD